MNILQKAAEILVECGYAIAYNQHNDGVTANLTLGNDGEPLWIENCDPFADTLEGRRQADAIEDWLCAEEGVSWTISGRAIDESETNYKLHEWRLDRIKWCFEELVNQ